MSEATAKGILKVFQTDANGDPIVGGGSAVSIADGADVAEGTKADAAWDGIAASATVVSILKKIATSGASAGLTDAQLRASAVPVSLTSTTITGSVAVTGPLTDTQLRASAVPVSLTSTTITGTVDVSDRAARLLGVVDKGKIWDGTNIASVKAASTAAAATDPALVVAISPNNTVPVSLASTTITGSVAVTGPLTDTQLRATAVPVSLTSTTITGSVAVTGPLTDTQLRATAVPVSGTFFQATQPISAAALPLPTGASTEATLALLQVAGGTAIGTLKSQLASAVAATSAPSYTDGTINPLSQTLAGALRIGGTVTAAQGTPGTAANKWPVSVTDGTNTQAVKAASTLAVAADPAAVVSQHPSRADASTLCVTTISAANTTITLTLPAPAAGLFHYITSLEIVNINPTAAAIAGSAVLLSYTTTNLPGSPAWNAGNALGIGLEKLVTRLSPTTPLKSSVAATATTVIAPAIGAGGQVRITATYYTAP